MTERESVDSRARGIQSVHRALDALEVVAESPGIGVTAMAQRMGVAVSTAHGIATTLAARGYLLNGSGAYDLGPAVIALGGRWSPARSLSAILQQAMDELSEQTGLSSTATVLDGDVAQIVAYVPAPGPITVRSGPERRPPLSLATGRVLVAMNHAGEWRRFVASSASIEPGWTVQRWQHELALIRTTGVAMKTTRDPRLEVSIAVPVHAPGGRVVCAIGCSSPSFLAEDLFNPEVLNRILDAGEALTEALGGEAPPRPTVDVRERGASA